jgi:hypothetical protein
MGADKIKQIATSDEHRRMQAKTKVIVFMARALRRLTNVRKR